MSVFMASSCRMHFNAITCAFRNARIARRLCPGTRPLLPPFLRVPLAISSRGVSNDQLALRDIVPRFSKLSNDRDVERSKGTRNFLHE